jgi:hypothetical protein
VKLSGQAQTAEEQLPEDKSGPAPFTAPTEPRSNLSESPKLGAIQTSTEGEYKATSSLGDAPAAPDDKLSQKDTADVLHESDKEERITEANNEIPPTIPERFACALTWMKTLLTNWVSRPPAAPSSVKAGLAAQIEFLKSLGSAPGYLKMISMVEMFPVSLVGL